MFIMGVNEEKYTGEETIVSTGSSTTTCLAPFVKTVHEKFDIVGAMMTIIHSYAPMQTTVNESSKKVGNDFQRKKIHVDVFVYRTGELEVKLHKTLFHHQLMQQKL